MFVENSKISVLLTLKQQILDQMHAGLNWVLMHWKKHESNIIKFETSAKSNKKTTPRPSSFLVITDFV